MGPDRMPDLGDIRDALHRETVRKAYEAYFSCSVCPRNCGVDRYGEEFGTCRTGVFPILSAYNIHFGEEPPLVGTGGSGAVFFGACNLSCDFCQNFPISQKDYGKTVTPSRLAEIYRELERRGAHNINLVTPSHIVPPVLHSLVLARQRGLGIPVVYNSNGYDSLEMLRLLEGWVDIYLPDMKYSDDQQARRISKAAGYVLANRQAVREMFRQVGPLVLDDRGIAVRGLIVRHLIMPNDLGGWGKTAGFLKDALGSGVPVSLMSQYFPTNRVLTKPLLSRPISEEEYDRALEILFGNDLLEGYVQEFEPDWRDTSAPEPALTDLPQSRRQSA
jgi:putative pyruvate formate lyase activating enzyme